MNIDWHAMTSRHWELGWQAALETAAQLLESPIVREDVTRKEMAAFIRNMKPGLAAKRERNEGGLER